MTSLHAGIDQRTYTAVRGAIFGLWAVTLALDPIGRLALLPAAAFAPPGPLFFAPPDLLSALLSPAGLALVRWGGAACCLAAAFLQRTIAVDLGACVALSVYQAIARSFGPVSHSEVQLMLAAYAFTAFRLADRVLERRPNRPPAALLHAYPFQCVAVLLSLTYFCSGLNRILSGGVSWIFDGSLLVFILETSAWTSSYPFDFSQEFARMAPAWLIGAGFALVTAAEISAPACVLSRRAVMVILPCLVVFHLLTFALMKIIFFEQVLLLTFWTDWPQRLFSATPIRDVNI